MIENIISAFDDCDKFNPISLGFAQAIDRAMRISQEAAKVAYYQSLKEASCTVCARPFRDVQPVLKLNGGEALCIPCVRQQPKIAEYGDVVAAEAPRSKAIRYLGALGQVWEAPELGVPQKPSSLGQLLVLGGLGAATGLAGGKLLNKAIPNDYINFEVPATLLGALTGSVPGLSSAYLNHVAGKPVWSESFWNSPDNPKTANYIPVDRFQKAVWSDMSSASLDPALQAAASGFVQGAANLPGKPRNSNFVTSAELAQMAVGLGGGAMSGWLFGKTIGNVLGMSSKAQNMIIGSGAFAGMLKTLVPKVYGQE